MTGVVKEFNDPRGYGYVEGADGVSYFVFYTEIRGEGFKTLAEDQRVEFDPADACALGKGPVAKNVRVILERKYA
jgi:cold shock protein